MIVVAFSGPALADKGDTIELCRLQQKSWELLHHGGMDELIREGQDNIKAFQHLKQREQETEDPVSAGPSGRTPPRGLPANNAPTGLFKTQPEPTTQVGNCSMLAPTAILAATAATP